MGGGLQTSAIAMGGLTPSASNATELYDGTTWTTSPATMATARETQQHLQLTILLLLFVEDPLKLLQQKNLISQPTPLQRERGLLVAV